MPPSLEMYSRADRSSVRQRKFKLPMTADIEIISSGRASALEKGRRFGGPDGVVPSTVGIVISTSTLVRYGSHFALVGGVERTEPL